ncbi:MAG: glycoside hydrolase family 3 protein, partial [Muriicola sp.]
IETIARSATDSQIEESFKRVWELKIKAMQQGSTSKPQISDPDPLNAKISAKSLTLYKGTEEIIAEYKDKGFYGLQFGQTKRATFFERVCESNNSPYLLVKDQSTDKIRSALGTNTKLLVALYPPNIKPQHQFGMDPVHVQLLKELINQYNLVLYVFGNPYFLRLLPVENITAIVVAYQDLKGFEENAAAHFLGNKKAMGVLPVSL